jgi:membrane dipeptidase
MKSVADLPNITYELLRRGYSDADVRKVLGGNFLRAFEQAEKVKQGMRDDGRGMK